MKNTETAARGNDAANLLKINAAFDSKKIDAAARDYLVRLYADGMESFRNIFYFLGRTLGAPKTRIYKYDSVSDEVAKDEMQISGIGPTDTYLVYHRFDNDPMRNQFFDFDGGSDIHLFVSSIVSVIVAAQKSVSRAIDKITGKYYDAFVDDVAAAAGRVLDAHGRGASSAAIQDKIRAAFGSRFRSQPAPEVLKIIGNLFPEISVGLVRELDGVTPPFARLDDVYRMKLLFDTVPQINAFIYHAGGVQGNEILSIKNKFYNLDGGTGYRDAKIIARLSPGIPLEVICNTRMFFDAERQTHAGYEDIRSTGRGAKQKVSGLHHSGVAEYNNMICRTTQELLHRVGWNILYRADGDIDSFFDGFPKIHRLPYSNKISETIMEKVADAVKNEIFKLPYSPRPLSQLEEISVFRYITRYILYSALPYSLKFEEVKGRGFSGKLFNFVMRELYRYYQNEVL
ncbi:MAG: hypothetical protein LBL21_04270 [Rickettsiales bacterium]|jgi:hypothetical protein|nr:hypothetical protein [Rickettsiales bacterium]